MSAPRRQTPMPPQMWESSRPVVARVMIAVLGGWGAAQLFLWMFNLSEVWESLSLDAPSLLAGEYWRLFTSQLVHAHVWQFFASVGILFVWGRELEPIIGRKPFAGLCLTAGLLGGVANCVVAPEVKSSGFSAASAAVLTAYATVLPELEHPLFSSRFARFKSKYLGFVLLAVAITFVATRHELEIGPAGIILGATLGWCWARRMGFGQLFWFHRRKEELREQALRRDRLSAEEFLEQEIDPILEKISREGMARLTKAERQILEDGRGKLAREKAVKE